jgi:hypothetical protein
LSLSKRKRCKKSKRARSSIQTNLPNNTLLENDASEHCSKGPSERNARKCRLQAKEHTKPFRSKNET